MASKVIQKNLVPGNLDMFEWTSSFHYQLVHTDFNMFVDEWTSANESPVEERKTSRGRCHSNPRAKANANAKFGLLPAANEVAGR